MNMVKVEAYNAKCKENRILREALFKIKGYVEHQRSWTGMSWKQNPLAVFVAERIVKKVDEALSKIKEGE